MLCLKESRSVLRVLWLAVLCVVAGAEQYYELIDPQIASDFEAEDLNDHLEALGRHERSVAFVPAPLKGQTPEAGIASKFQEEFEREMQQRLARFPSNSAYGSSSEATRSAYGSSSEATQSTHDGYTTAGPSTTKASVEFSTESVSGYRSTQASKDIHKDEYKTTDAIRIGSVKGVPGVHFPDYTDIPLTSFTCSDKKYLPGFYADMETGCQVFHVCWPDRQETFLCPMGTTFNQPLLACDNWYSSNCSLALHYYDVNVETDALKSLKTDKSDSVSSMIKHLLDKSLVESTTRIPEENKADFTTSASISSFISQYLPVKAKVVVHPEKTGQRSKIVATASVGEKRKVKQSHSGSVSHVPRVSLSEKAIKLALDEMEFQKVEDLKHEIFTFRLNEALDNVVNCVKHDGSTVRFYALVDSVVKLVKVIIFSFHSEPYEPALSGAMKEYDLAVKQSLDKLPMLVKDILINMATLVSEAKPNPPHKVAETVNVKRVPLTSLNKRFIVKPVVTRPTNSAYRVKPGVKSRRVLIARPLNFSRNDDSSVLSGTKKALLKNYESLIQARKA